MTTPSTRPSSGATRGRAAGAARLVAALAGAVLVAFGVWAFAHPASFFEEVAHFEPYNAHFLRDVGAFQLGLGAVLLLSLWWRDGLLVALTGVGIGAVAHVVGHAIDHDLGGTPLVDIPALGVLAVALLAAAVARAAALRAASGAGDG